MFDVSRREKPRRCCFYNYDHVSTCQWLCMSLSENKQDN